METVRRALLLGCVRKSMSLIERPTAQPVRRLRSFEELVREVERERFPAAYWQHPEFNLGRCEDYSQRKPATAPGRARPNLAQAEPGKPAVLPRPHRTRKENEMMMTNTPRTNGDPLDGGASGRAS